MAKAAPAVSETVQRRKRSDQANHNALRAIVVPIRKDIPQGYSGETEDASWTDSAVHMRKQAGDEPGHSKSVAEDPFIGLSHRGEVIEPPFDLLTLAMLEEQNTELTPVIETMEANIDGFGHHLVPRFDVKTVAEGERKRVKKDMRKEKVKLTNFFNYANIKDSFRQLRKKRRKDIEATGNAYWEIIRTMGGDIQGFEHLPSYQMRLGKQEPHHIKVEIPTLQLQEDGSFEIKKIETWQRFRKYVQSRLIVFRGITAEAGGFKVRWFKEFGDPRVYDNETGELVPDEKVNNWKKTGKPMPQSHRANEVIHSRRYSTRSPYGLPRFIGSLLAIYGSRAAEEINYVTFRNMNIPSMVIMVSNGQLTEGSIERITSFVESQIQGSDNYSKFLILEAEGMLEGEDAGQIKMEIKPLVQIQHKDALFQNYSKQNKDNVRTSFRLPPIFVGRSEDYTRATAETSRRLADEQVFAPERDEFDEFINRLLFPVMGVRYHTYKSNSPNTTDNMELVRILSGAEKTGGMTPRIARLILEDILGMELPDFPEDDKFDPDLPFSLLMAEAVKNVGDPAEPGQQVTALKKLEQLGYFNAEDESFEPTVEELVITHINRLRKRLESKWEAQVVEDAHDIGLDLDEPPL